MNMGFYHGVKLCMLVIILVSEILLLSVTEAAPTFDQNYHVYYGNDHVSFSDHGRTAQLSLDSTTGAGFESKRSYRSGLFEMNMKPPSGDSAGIITCFYLISARDGVRDEIDFEFMGNRPGKPIFLQTNIFKNGKGEREQRIKLWFDPTEKYHNYRILWNQHHIVFFVDGMPIRVFKNRGHYPAKKMKAKASIWNGENWATDGGTEKINWAFAPFRANYEIFNIDGCSGKDCSSPRYYWNNGQYLKLNQEQEKFYNDVKKKYIVYDYCDDKTKYHSYECE